MEEKSRPPSLITLMLLISLASVGALFFSPAIPEIKDYFLISPSRTQLTITVYLIGYAIGQLIYAPIAERTSRKKAIYLGLLIAAIGSLLCGLSDPVNSFNMLLISRFIMGLGTAAGYALTFTIINDYYSHEQVRRVIPKVAIGLTTLPFVAIIFGGIFVHYLYWRSAFYLLVFYSFFILYLSTKLPETGQPPKEIKQLSFREILDDYIRVVKYGRLPIFSLIVGSCVAIFYIFGGVAPFIAIHVMGLRSFEYGLMNIFPLLGALLGMLLAMKTAKYISAVFSILFSLALNFVAVFVMLVLFYLGIQNIWVLFLPAFVFFIGISLIWANGAALATKDIPDKSHAASAMSFISIGSGVVAMIIIGFFQITNLVVMPLFFLSIIIIQFICLGIAMAKGYE